MTQKDVLQVTFTSFSFPPFFCPISDFHINYTNMRELNFVGQPMVPISWQEMQCPETKALEKRKVAKVTA